MGNDSAGLTDTIQAPPDKIIAALTDFESFPEWQDAVLECEVLDRDDEGRGSRVRMKVDAKKIHFEMRPIGSPTYEVVATAASGAGCRSAVSSSTTPAGSSRGWLSMRRAARRISDCPGPSSRR